ncbi:MAG: isopentenyl-diphosphate Delta-isomerase [Acidobacteria bacterium]|nr:isopentenyl-diphosphate Delta-isomerase [Acidobacteriota bacterium]
MLKTSRISIFTAIVLVLLASGAVFMTRVEMPRWANVLSSINVLLFAVPSFWALKLWLGWRDAAKLVAILGIYAVAAEILAVYTGFPYGHIGYSGNLGYKLFGVVPWTIAFAWTPLMLCSYTAARDLFVSRRRRILFSTFLLLAFDLVLDPGAVTLGFWSYTGGGVYYGVPALNFLGWVVVGMVGSLITEFTISHFRPMLPPPVQIGSSAFFIIFFWTALAAVAGLGIPAAIGGGCAIAMYLWYRRSYYAFDEMVVLVDEENNPLATARKSETHNADTKLHRAFSVFLFNSKGELLLQRRAFGKLTWPGVWSNSCCGHTMLNERTEQAAARRLGYELGLRNVELHIALPHFRYRAEKDGVVENEICPVLVGVTDQEPSINPHEVAEVEWIAWDDFLDSIADSSCELSPWAVEEGFLLAKSPVLRKVLGFKELKAAA